MHQDAYGLDVTVASPAAAAAFGEMAHGFLAHGASTAVHLGEALRLDPDFGVAHACRGLFCLTLGRRELMASAADAARLAEDAVTSRGATVRERHYVAALRLWLDGRPSAAARRFDDLLAVWPQDALAFKFAQAARFMLGDLAGMRASAEHVLPRVGADHPALGYLLGCHAFTLEESGEYAAAERTGRRGLEIAPDDAWGLHAVAHVFDMTARPDAGVAFLHANRAAWAHCNNFRYHVWWHLALLHLDRGETSAALALYDAEVRRDRTDDYRDIANATSLLMRLELEGVSVGDRWEELAALCAGRVEDGCLAFADLHYLLALCADDRIDAAGALTRRMQLDALRAGGDTDAVMRRPGLSMARGLQAFAAGHYAAALDHLRLAQPLMASIGGSHAQRDVFDRIAIEAAIRSGSLSEAQTMLAERDARRGARDGFAARRTQLVADLANADARAASNRLA